jgi:hypothetical protein
VTAKKRQVIATRPSSTPHHGEATATSSPAQCESTTALDLAMILDIGGLTIFVLQPAILTLVASPALLQ